MSIKTRGRLSEFGGATRPEGARLAMEVARDLLARANRG